jgi:diguanylate cyclase (GGDEF)-like protein
VDTIDGRKPPRAKDLEYNILENTYPNEEPTRRYPNIMTAERRQTIGVLIGGNMYEGSRPYDYNLGILRGIQAAARDQGVNLMLAAGVNRGIEPERQFHPAWPEIFSTSDFVPIGPWNTDGLLIFSPLYFREEFQYLQEIREKGFPELFIGSGAGTPEINVDNEGGFRQILEHLVGHGHRAIAMVAGVVTDGDSQSRLKAYREAVGALGLTDDPRLVEFGQHVEEGGYDAMKRILQSGVKFSAVACSNDISAIGAFRAIKEAGLRIPWDVAVTGFDDQIAALAEIPPLSSVHYPLFETGYRALLMMRKRLERGPGSIPEETRVGTWLVPRQSCGCIPEAVKSSIIHNGASFDSDRLDPKRFKESLSQAMRESLLAENTPSNIPDSQPLCDRLAESFLLSLADGDLSHFQIALMEMLQRIETMEDDANAWQSAISILRNGAYALLSDDLDAGRRVRAEDLVNQARTLISDSARRRYVRNQFQQNKIEEAMGRLTARLLSSLEEEQIYSTLEDGLPRVGVRSGYIALFEPQGDDPVGGSRIRTYQKDAPAVRFATREFPPAGLYPEGEPFSLALLPLVFKEEKMGYVAFDGANLDPLATLVGQIASALKSAELHGKVLELSLTDGLTGVHNRRYFEMFLQKEVERGIRYNRRLSTIMIDIDHFKEYNDSFGHPAGDDALRKVAEDIQNGARRGLDVISRYGGEEFAVILPETEVEGARIVAEKIRQSIEADTRFQRKLSISLGIATLSGEQLGRADLVELADRALYQAKDQGRNRTVLYEEWMQDSAHTKKPA